LNPIEKTTIMKTTAYLLSLTWMICVASTVSAAAPAAEDIAVLTESAEKGDSDAMFRLGRAFLLGNGVKKDTQRAYDLMSAAAEKGHADALGGVGYFHSEGVVVPKDPEEAARWFRKGAEKGSPKSCLNLGKNLLSKSERSSTDADVLREEALGWIRKAADQDLPEAAYSLGLIYYHGDHGQPQDYKLAAKYLKIAADADNADAQNILGVMHQYAQGTPMDEDLAKRLYRKAALQGHLKAQSNLARLLGPAVEDRKTRVEAVAWLIIAASQNEAAAVKLLRDAPAELKPGDMEEAKKLATVLRSQISKSAK
jgi:TPR repeat protein